MATYHVLKICLLTALKLWKTIIKYNISFRVKYGDDREEDGFCILLSPKIKRRCVRFGARAECDDATTLLICISTGEATRLRSMELGSFVNVSAPFHLI